MTIPANTTVRNAETGPTEQTSNQLALRFTHQLLDVLCGRRSPAQLRDRVTPQVLGLLTRSGPKTARSPGYRLSSVHACLATERTVEACAVIGTPNRARALVLRLERTDSRWLCTLLSVL
ncbi:hypothetical protein IQ251_17990 [Saccharopolyspora sp. HNM0983]|uniref:3-hydroxyacyl-CoA dehydrogenase n=1 Tax=Saccharopolyspora montiporae TaxID=2781240 RepID=A0A929BDG6_9PSEU|nr:Rv3235 family protein [Saccharopolyspora sp. HNM0983]MBE9376345.1 hypothetical protein [Saccharopolyspora sp. HNM0983]